MLIFVTYLDGPETVCSHYLNSNSLSKIWMRYSATNIAQISPFCMLLVCHGWSNVTDVF